MTGRQTRELRSTRPAFGEVATPRAARLESPTVSGSERVLQRAESAVRRARAALDRQPSRPAPAWPRYDRDHLDLATTGLILLQAGLRDTLAAELAVEWAAAELRRHMDGDVDVATWEACIWATAGVICVHPSLAFGQAARAWLLEHPAPLDGPRCAALGHLLAQQPQSPAIRDQLNRLCAQLTPPGCLDEAVDVLETLTLGGASPEGSEAGRAALDAVDSGFDCFHRCWQVTSGSDLEATARIIWALAGATGGEWRGRAAEVEQAVDALCAQSLWDGGWADDRTWPGSTLDNRGTARAIGALTAFLDRASPLPVPLGARRRLAVDLLYADPVEVDLARIPLTRGTDHTMFEALDPYASQKLPRDRIASLRQRGGRIEVHGTYPTHLPSLVREATVANIRPLERETRREQRTSTTKRFNSVRPRFFEGVGTDGRPVLLVGVGCGEDYVLHYASMLRHEWSLSTSEPAGDRLRVVRYPAAERDLPIWTGLDESFVRAGDRVVLGYVEECRSRLGDETTEAAENEFYGSDSIGDSAGGRITFLGVKFSYWGSISERIVERICQLGASEVLYVGKLGALTSPVDLYERIFSPSQFALLHHDRPQRLVEPAPPNGILAWQPTLDTGLHVSIPTVLEEDYHQRALAQWLRVNSIDNEIACMAAAIADHNASSGRSVRFSAVHFATDYIRREDERSLRTQYDLARMRAPEARSARRRILDRIACDVLGPYLGLRARP